jgi:hypothetical protein
VAVQTLQRLHRGLSGSAPVKLGGHDFAVFGHLLLPDDHQVPVGDRRPGHRVPLDPQHEQGPAADQSPGQQEGLLGQLHGVQGDAGRDLPDERYLDLVALGPGCGVGGLYNRARLSGPAVQAAFGI